ncbi:MAG: PPC domain-containing protein [Phycisphaerales bacterium]|nr:MAG: PPC domain-containing protein [Phycisphaerales bacterium]
MQFVLRPTLVVLVLCTATVWGQSTNEPHIGYLYPAGGQAGTTVQIVAGGQFLRSALHVYVSGDGVHAKVVEYIKPLRNLQKEQREFLQGRLKELRDQRLAALPQPRGRRARAASRNATDRPGPEKAEEVPEIKEVELPDHPLLRDLESKSLRELAHVKEMIFFSRTKLQPNRQLAEMVLIEVTIDADAAPGNRELRIKAAAGLSNPIVFQVEQLPEVRELEPNDGQAYPDLPGVPAEAAAALAQPVALPVVLNGRIMPGDVDRFRFRARQGQQLAMEVQARGLIPYLADAVPGWFQATLALYDARGNEVAYADDYRFNPDPVLFYEIPADGEYELEIHDSIYRGREDFVYSIVVSARPFITQMFPLGGRAGADTVATIGGWNLPETSLTLNTAPASEGIAHAAYTKGRRRSNSVPYAVDTLPEIDEAESNDTPKRAQKIDLPVIVNGRIAAGGDVDVFRVRGRAGARVVAEVTARRLNSPLDSLLRLTDDSGNVLAWNDDYVEEEGYLHKDRLGLVTHHADSYLSAELPRDGTYYVRLSDALSHGGQAYGYRLRISAPRPDFALRVTPSSVQVKMDGTVPFCVHALRQDGFAGAIDVTLKDPPTGFSLGGGRIPAGSDRICMTLKAPAKALDRAVAVHLEGRAVIEGQTVSRVAVAADDVMQAFLYRHLVPAQEFMVLMRHSRSGMPPAEVAADGPVRIPAGGSARVLVKMPRRRILEEMRPELKDPPAGMILDKVAVVPQGLELTLKVGTEVLRERRTDNLIVEVAREYTPKEKDGTPSKKKRRYSLGVLPAIPVEIVSQ